MKLTFSRLSLTVFILALSLSLFGCPPMTETTVTDEQGFIYQEYGDGYTVFLDNVISEEHLVVPDSFNGLPIVSIGVITKNLVDNNVKSIVLPETLVNIHEFTFSGFSLLESITIPESVEYIGSFAFAYCSKLVSITIPEKVLSIPDHAFLDCTSLESVIIKAEEFEIGALAFGGATSLVNIEFNENSNYIFENQMILDSTGTTLIYYIGNHNSLIFTVPEGITSVFNFAFYGNSTLIQVILPEGITSIGAYAFSGMNKLTTVSMPSTLETISDYAFHMDIQLKYIILNEGLKTIGNSVFFGSEVLNTIIIPSSVQSIGYDVFGYCNELSEIIVDENNSDYTSVDGVLFTKDMSTLLVYPSGKIDSIYTVPTGVVTIASSAFEPNYYLYTVYVSEGVRQIEADAFQYCQIKVVYLPSTLEYIGSGAFYGNPSMIIHVALSSEPDNWAANWHMNDQKVYWDN